MWRYGIEWWRDVLSNWGLMFNCWGWASNKTKQNHHLTLSQRHTTPVILWIYQMCLITTTVQFFKLLLHFRLQSVTRIRTDERFLGKVGDKTRIFSESTWRLSASSRGVASQNIILLNIIIIITYARCIWK